MPLPNLAIAQLPVERVQFYERKTRKHSDVQVAPIAASIAGFREVTATQIPEVQP